MKIGIIADDLTGANATGVRLAKAGFVSAAVVFGGGVPTSGNFTAISIDTDSRYIKPDTAKYRVQKAYRQLKEWGADVVAKRIDSTVRGNLGAETDALLDAIGPGSIAVVVASYPDSGRVTSGGYLLVEGMPVQATDVAKDPMNPIASSYVPDVIKEQSRYEVGHIGLGTVLKGAEAILPAMKALMAANKRIIVVDAVTNEEIDHIAESMAAIDEYAIIPVDPGPLSAAYGRVKSRQSIHLNKWIVTVGSVTPLTGRQIRYLIDKTNSHPVYVNAANLASLTDSWEEEVQRATKEALEKLKEEEILIITTQSPASIVLPLSEIAKEEGTTEETLAKRITDGLAKITYGVFKERGAAINGTFSSGGDVTAALCAVSKAEAIQLEDEVLPLAAYGKFIGGALNGIPVVTKGGMVGDKQSIYQCVNYLRTKNHEGRV
ncbi:four-carbon acid sugar kinase family protein [Bacillus sp. PK3_68]|uniref:four-carbon acid sugar kinase family protein n=1 Tax=Bacillus sp. PK3_68 TaxID=2027408 RepID=UPI000E7707A1|nr:four-carbon acid sugar kinase family protein [Bacillus sp. PK3_68]RJS61938.1 hypothetical protein CJ483_19380 [Bacillus sp. PK3_68]